MPVETEEPKDVLAFWFAESSRARWFNSTPEFDQEIRARFEALWKRARDGQLSDWEHTPEGVLALVILLDQMPLNMFRDQLQGFSTEAQSREIANRAIVRGLDSALTDIQKVFVYLPYMHSESLADQDRSVALFEAAGLRDNHRWAKHHREIIRRFARFPHRNRILGRESTRDELQWLASEHAFTP